VTGAGEFDLSLFPLRAVLFPGGLLNLKVFEARYLDLVSRCLREGRGFGVICLRQGDEVRGTGRDVRFEAEGVVTRLDEVDAAQAGILHVRCIGERRVALEAPRQQADGLWLARARWLPDDEHVGPPPEMQPTVRALANAIETLAQQQAFPFVQPYRLDDAGWVANRWCELLPISLAAKQKLMALDDPLMRLRLVDEFLRQRGVVTD
jgi:Lon protease-like protein